MFGILVSAFYSTIIVTHFSITPDRYSLYVLAYNLKTKNLTKNNKYNTKNIENETPCTFKSKVIYTK